MQCDLHYNNNDFIYHAPFLTRAHGALQLWTTFTKNTKRKCYRHTEASACNLPITRTHARAHTRPHSQTSTHTHTPISSTLEKGEFWGQSWLSDGENVMSFARWMSKIWRLLCESKTCTTTKTKNPTNKPINGTSKQKGTDINWLPHNSGMESSHAATRCQKYYQNIAE